MKKIVMIIMAVALIALPAMAQDWESTSSMQGSGSAYSSPVTAVGAAQAADMGTTTTVNYAPGRPGNIRKTLPGGTTEPGQSTDSPIGDAVLPLMLMAFAFVGYTAIRRKRQAEKA